MQESTCLHYFHTTFLLWSVLNGLLGDQDDWFGEFGVLSSWFWLGPFREPESQIQRQRGDHQLAMYYRYLQLEGAKKIRRLYSAILWVWMGCPIFTKCLDNHWIPESSLGPTDKRVDRGGECHISEPEKTICVEPFRNLFWVPSHVPSSLSDSYPWSGLNGILSWDGVRASLQTAVLGLLDLTKSLLICADSLGAVFFLSIQIDASYFYFQPPINCHAVFVCLNQISGPES